MEDRVSVYTDSPRKKIKNIYKMETKEPKKEVITSAERATEEGNLMLSSLKNISEFIKTDTMPSWVSQAIIELIEDENWEELNNRFHENLAFGTGGMRGRTIGKTVTKSEMGSAKEGESPTFAAVGTNTLNELTVIRATKALFMYVRQWMAENGILEQPRLVVAHDIRHFSAKFTELTVNTWAELGGFAMTFDGPRSTPQLSFTVRNRYSHAGVVITASHNPYHDNGFKVYFSDGAQIVAPHANHIIENYNRISLKEVIELLNAKQNENVAQLTTLDDLSYRAALEETVLDEKVIKEQSLKAVFTPIHGTGGISAVPALWDQGVEVCVVDQQNVQDPNFSSVKSPNPENPEALKLAIDVAAKTKSDLVMGSDPDCDRIGVAAPDSKGKFKCLSGNQVASMLAEYRIYQFTKKQILKNSDESEFAILKTFVTSPLIQKIAENAGCKCINTPTGFKWMAQKLRKNEEKAVVEMREKEGVGLDYDSTDLFTRIEILSRYSTYVILAAEESYGYLPVDLVRDKDGNASALAIAELFAFLKSSKITAFDYLDTIYRKYGYHAEKTENIYFEGAKGKETIDRLTKTYRENPPDKIFDISVKEQRDFLDEGQVDEDDELLPAENFLILTLDNGFSLAIRPSGTEPKIKYYIFGSEINANDDLDDSKERVDKLIENIGKWLVEDAHSRVAD